MTHNYQEFLRELDTQLAHLPKNFNISIDTLKRALITKEYYLTYGSESVPSIAFYFEYSSTPLAAEVAAAVDHASSIAGYNGYSRLDEIDIFESL